MSKFFDIPNNGANHSCEVEKQTCEDSTTLVPSRDTVVQGTSNETPTWSDSLLDGEGPIQRITMAFVSVHRRLTPDDHSTCSNFFSNFHKLKV